MSVPHDLEFFKHFQENWLVGPELGGQLKVLALILLELLFVLLLDGFMFYNRIQAFRSRPVVFSVN